jgi:ABC-2 type transport system ATP-binding protein
VNAIEAAGLHREFRRGKTPVSALRDVTLSIPRGQVFGLLGPNGAGKTTFVRTLATLLVPTSGTVRVAGHDVVREPQAVRRSVGCVFGGDAGLYERLSGRDNLRYFAELYGVPGKVARRRTGELLEAMGLAAKADHRVETYSRGMRQRLHLARGLIHDPDVVLLDEPTIGIDPVGARELRALVQELRGRGKTVLLTTHYMYEADELCDQIAVIVHGEIAARGTSAQLKSMVEAATLIEVEVRGVSEAGIGAVREIPGVRAVEVEVRDQVQLLKVQTLPGEDVTQAVFGVLGDVPVGRVSTREPTLEDAYVQLVQRRGTAREVNAGVGQ